MPPNNKQPKTNKFRDAFDRLKSGKPNILKVGEEISQANVAREAGCKNPSDFRKDRNELLIAEIQAYIRQNDAMPTKPKNIASSRRLDLKQTVEALTLRTEELMSEITAQDNYIETLLDELHELKSGKIKKF